MPSLPHGFRKLNEVATSAVLAVIDTNPMDLASWMALSDLEQDNGDHELGIKIAQAISGDFDLNEANVSIREGYVHAMIVQSNPSFCYHIIFKPKAKECRIYLSECVINRRRTNQRWSNLYFFPYRTYGGHAEATSWGFVWESNNPPLRPDDIPNKELLWSAGRTVGVKLSELNKEHRHVVWPAAAQLAATTSEHRPESHE